jgi:hypothetical protein
LEKTDPSYSVVPGVGCNVECVSVFLLELVFRASACGGTSSLYVNDMTLAISSFAVLPMGATLVNSSGWLTALHYAQLDMGCFGGV